MNKKGDSNTALKKGNRRIGDKKKELDADIPDFDIVREGNEIKKVFRAPKEFDIGV